MLLAIEHVHSLGTASVHLSYARKSNLIGAPIAWRTHTHNLPVRHVHYSRPYSANRFRVYRVFAARSALIIKTDRNMHGVVVVLCLSCVCVRVRKDLCLRRRLGQVCAMSTNRPRLIKHACRLQCVCARVLKCRCVMCVTYPVRTCNTKRPFGYILRRARTPTAAHLRTLMFVYIALICASCYAKCMRIDRDTPLPCVRVFTLPLRRLSVQSPGELMKFV